LALCRYSGIGSVLGGGRNILVERILQIIRANPAQMAAIGGLVLVVIVAWIVESSRWRAHR